LSNDWALRRLGPRLWKQAQRGSYGLFVLALAHGVIFQQMGKRAWPLVAVLLTVAGATIAGQLGALVARPKVRQ
jgi:DMSO/TMAO reductase YedYZ heme-binding membrane subunit